MKALLFSIVFLSLSAMGSPCPDCQHKNQAALGQDLLRAAKRGDSAKIEHFRRCGADINTQNKNGNSPPSTTHLHIAAWKGDTHIVVRILARTTDTDINAKNQYGDTPLHYAAEGGHLDIVKLLLACDEIDTNLKNNEGETPLHITGHAGVVALLLTHKETDVNAKNKYGNTPLHYAAYNDAVDVAELLLAHNKIDINVKNIDGLTPLALAKKYKRTKVARLIALKGGR